MIKYLLPKEGQFFKANLHCHSNISDGGMSPEKLKEVYKSLGYSIVAYTDHDVLIPHHQELSDEEFLALNGYEMEVNSREFENDPMLRKTCHMCMIALEPDNVKQVCFHRSKYIPPYVLAHTPDYMDRIQFYEEEPDYIREYTPECISDMMKRGREHGFFVTYNHPTWSQESYEQYTKYDHMNAMEMFNYQCGHEGYEEYNTRVYDDMLRAGKKIYCLGTDDTHTDYYGGPYTMIKADRLDYRTVTKALEEGNFYASEGPEIKELWVEDGYLHVKTSDAARIIISCGIRNSVNVDAPSGGSVNSASAKLLEKNVYMRVTVVDRFGKRATSNAYFMEDIL